MMTRQGNILVVDDEPAIRKVLFTKLSREGYTCREADGAEAALAQLAGDLVDLVILDIKMPGRSGSELLPDIRNRYPDTSVIMATAVADASVAIQCMKEGAQDYLRKPFSLDEVVLAVERALEKRRLRLELREYRQRLEQKVGEQTKEMRKLFVGAIESLVFAIEANDKYTAGHSRRVADISVAIGRRLGLSRYELEELYCGALLHDVGKIAIDPAVQNKAGRLTSEEYEYVRAHSKLGAGIVKPMVSEGVIEIILHHHDYYRPAGPDRAVAAEDIPLGARIVAVADTFDAMTSDRPYRPAMSAEEAAVEIRRCSGTQLDPVVVEAFFKIPPASRQSSFTGYLDLDKTTVG